MKRIMLIMLAAILAVPFSDLAVSAASEDDPGKILVAFKPDTVTAVAHRSVGAKRTSHIEALNIDVVKVDDVDDALSLYRRRSDVLYAERNHVVRALGAPNDPLYGQQWNFQPVGPTNNGTANVEGAWDLATGVGVKVAVLDTGVRPGFDLEATRVLQGKDFIGEDFDNDGVLDPGEDADGDGTLDDTDDFPTDDNGHGTHVAGTIAQITGNGTGTAGVAPNALILPVRVLDHDGAGLEEDVIKGMLWARDNGADVLNLSLGGPDASAAVCAAVHEVAKTVPVVVAAGNSSTATAWGSVGYPAACPDAIAVAAADRNGIIAPYSSVGPEIDIVAPGGSCVMTSSPVAEGASSCEALIDPIVQETFNVALGVTEWEYSGYVGTSMAAPHVAGTIALIRGISRFLDVRKILALTTRNFPDPIVGSSPVPSTTTTVPGPPGALPPPIVPIFDSRGVDTTAAVTLAKQMVPTIGYRFAGGDGGVYVYGLASHHGSMTGTRLARPIVSMAGTPTGNGYWLVASDGGIFSFGDAKFYGSTGGMSLARPIVGMASTPTGNGYWLVASDGGIFAYGDAKFYGSTGAIALAKPIVGMASTPTGNGYWLVASDGGIFAYGDAKFFGSTGAVALAQPITSMAAHPSGNGYWLLARDGGIFTFGSVKYFGSGVSRGTRYPAVSMASVRGGDGYWIVLQNGSVVAFGAATHFGPARPLNVAEAIVTIAPV